MSTKSKKLSIAEYGKLEKKFHERKSIRISVTLPDGKTNEYDHTIAEIFKPTDITKLCIDYASLLSELQDTPDVTAETFYNANSLLNALIIKYFSDVPIPSKLEDIQSVIKVSEVLFNLGIMEQLFSEKGFNQSEIDKLNVALEKQSKLFGAQFGEMAIKSGFNMAGDDTDGHNESETT